MLRDRDSNGGETQSDYELEQKPAIPGYQGATGKKQATNCIGQVHLLCPSEDKHDMTEPFNSFGLK